MEEQNLMPFEDKSIRKVWHNEEWHFSVVDVVGVLAESANPQSYWGQLKKREPHLLTICQKVRLKGQDGKNYPSDCANTEGVLRIAMSVPSPKAEPLKLWLAEQGKRAIDEVENPELLTERQAEIYRAKGYPEEWINRRVQSIETRKALTDEWKKRGVSDSKDYSILTATIAKGTFGLTPSEHRKVKGLEKQNLRDHMTPIELIFSALGEETTRLLTEKEDAQGYTENHDVAVKGGLMVGESLKGFENRTGLEVVSSDNFLSLKSGDKPKELPKNEA